MAAAAAMVLLAAGCASPRPFPTLTYAERHCYRTLAEVDCYAAALPGEESRKVGFYDAPVAVEQEEAWPQRLF
jgi:hypothetical protein